VLISATRTSVFGYHNGYRASEGARFHDTYVYRARRGYVIAPSNGDISGLIGAAHCTTAVHFEGAAVVSFHLSFERWNQAGRWYHTPPGGDITAGRGVVPLGKIEYKLNLPGLGTTPADLSTTGTGSMNLINLTTGKSTKWASVP
jgi:hypothetical protein